MTKLFLLALSTVLFASPSMAHARHHHHSKVHHMRAVDANGNDPRPHAWCGYWMRHHLGVADRSYNLARNWSHYGAHAGGPAVGTIVVWAHHVGIVTGGSPGHWIVKSGNDGHAVRERERSLSGAIAFRWPNGEMNVAEKHQLPRQPSRGHVNTYDRGIRSVS